MNAHGHAHPASCQLHEPPWARPLPSTAALRQDLYVGGQLEVFNRAFELTGADEYSYTYMENNKHIFVMADADAIIESLRAQVCVCVCVCVLVCHWSHH